MDGTDKYRNGGGGDSSHYDHLSTLGGNLTTPANTTNDAEDDGASTLGGNPVTTRGREDGDGEADDEDDDDGGFVFVPESVSTTAPRQPVAHPVKFSYAPTAITTPHVVCADI